MTVWVEAVDGLVVGTWLVPGAELVPGVTWTCEAEPVALGELVCDGGVMTWLAVLAGMAEGAPDGAVDEAVLEVLTPPCAGFDPVGAAISPTTCPESLMA